VFEEIGIDAFLGQTHEDSDSDRTKVIRHIADSYIVEYDEIAIALYKKLIELCPQEPELYYTLGSAEIELGMWDEARNVFRQGFAVAPHHADLQNMVKSLDAYESFNSDVAEPPMAASDSFYCIDLRAGNDTKKIYLTKSAVLSEKDCRFVIAAAESYASSMNDWTYHRHKSYPTSDIPIHCVPEVLSLFNQTLTETVFPMLAALYPCQSIRVHDAFIVKYSTDSEKIQRYLPQHFDQSTHSLTIALNSQGDEFKGGGTLFGSALSISPKQGQLMSFTGSSIFHGYELLLSLNDYYYYYLTITTILQQWRYLTVGHKIHLGSVLDHHSCQAREADNLTLVHC